MADHQRKSRHDTLSAGLHVSDREDCRGQVDADWGWGRGWCGDCHGSLSLQDDDGRTFRNNGCPFDRSPQGRDLYQFYCSQNKAADLVASLLPRFKCAPPRLRLPQHTSY